MHNNFKEACLLIKIVNDNVLHSHKWHVYNYVCIDELFFQLGKLISLRFNLCCFSVTGRVDLPMVAFNAYNPLDKSMETGQILIMQNVRLNKGEGYDKVIGIFTAPETGLYFFNVHVCTHGGMGFYYDIILENSHIARSTNINTVQSDCSSVSAITTVTSGQRVWVKCTSGSTSNQLYESSYWQTSFSGVLLRK